eukprot:gene32022-16545_t
MSISVGTAQTICRALPWVVLSLLLFHCSASTEEECSALIDSYKSEHQKEASPYTGDNLIFSYMYLELLDAHSLVHAETSDPTRQRCPKAYDNLARIDTAVPNCGLLSSHDDFSIISKLPDDVAVLTHIRDPRASMENEKPNPETFLYCAAHHMRALYPLCLLWAINAPGSSSIKWILSEAEEDNVLPSLDPYNNRLYMPLHEFMETDIAHELLHNGETYQVLGITNYSHWNDAEELRHCMTSYPSAMEAMFNISKARIQRFHHASFAFPLSGPAYADQKPPRDGDKKLSEDRFSTGGPQRLTLRNKKNYLKKFDWCVLHEVAAVAMP